MGKDPNEIVPEKLESEIIEESELEKESHLLNRIFNPVNKVLNMTKKCCTKMKNN